MSSSTFLDDFYRDRLHTYVDTALRIPSLFVMDEILKWSCGISNLESHNYKYEGLFQEESSINQVNHGIEDLNDSLSVKESFWLYFSNNSDNVPFSEEDVSASLSVLGKISCCLSGIAIAFVVFLLSWKNLLKVYSFILSFILIVVSYQANMSTIKLMVESSVSKSGPSLLQAFLSLNFSNLWDSGGIAFSIICNYMLQLFLGLLFTFLVPMLHYSILRALTILSFLIPTFLLTLPLPPESFLSIPVFTAMLPLLSLKVFIIINLRRCIIVVVEGYYYARTILHNYGLHSLLESEWSRLNVPNVLRTFWLLRTAHHISFLLTDYMYLNGTYQSLLKINLNEFYLMFKSVLIHGCETRVAILGMTSIVSYISHYISLFFQTILMADNDEERSMGTVCAVLFFVLAQQSGLTMLEGEKRFIRLCRNFSFLFTAMLHFTHNMVNPVLMSLSASPNPAIHRHVRALIVCSMLIGFPCIVLYILWDQFPFSTWLLAVSAFSVQVIVKTFVSLMIYSLFLYDSYHNMFWESLDDYVYYIRAFGNTVEFLFGILLFFTGAWIYFFECGGAIRAVMMCIHAYFNIWCEAKNGWIVFMKRRTAVQKINSLPEATAEQLEKHSDVCAICFQDLHTAKITRCNHFFHSVCLRKWLYVQDTCPLCHETLYKIEKVKEGSDNIPDENRTEGGVEQNTSGEAVQESEVVNESTKSEATISETNGSETAECTQNSATE